MARKNTKREQVSQKYKMEEVLPLAFVFHKYYGYHGVRMPKPTTRDLFNIVTDGHNNSKEYKMFQQRVLLEACSVDDEFLHSYLMNKSALTKSEWAKKTHEVLSQEQITSKDINFVLSSVVFMNKIHNRKEFIREKDRVNYYRGDMINYEIGEVIGIKNNMRHNPISNSVVGLPISKTFTIRTFTNNVITVRSENISNSDSELQLDHIKNKDVLTFTGEMGDGNELAACSLEKTTDFMVKNEIIKPYGIHCS